MKKWQETENVWALGLFLAAVGFLAALVLALISQLTAGPIREAAARQANEALRQVLPAFDNQPSEDRVTVKLEDGREVIFYRARRGGELVGVAAEGEVPGYAGPVRGLVGFDPDGTVRTMLILKQQETPGLGANVCSRQEKKTIFTLFSGAPKREGLPPNPVLDQFSGRRSDGTPWRVTKDGGDAVYITGATVTSRAVTQLAYELAEAFRTRQQEVSK